MLLYLKKTKTLGIMLMGIAMYVCARAHACIEGDSGHKGLSH